ncbi:uncharacterized protein TM35_000022140 [Trypanosoma theileri]|uniref:Uncharacterized protein n=1 Tax=Trypanosoma theileri TaxID=67003 RepID=A0A1X0P7N4_9TRYP|nr:uncharacterized protein TM35_000022140 [Trypanosoma theileri]ORC92888.1 hypothetical protein TM35_000022140 [Trypanosoma theileri]
MTLAAAAAAAATATANHNNHNTTTTRTTTTTSISNTGVERPSSSLSLTHSHCYGESPPTAADRRVLSDLPPEGHAACVSSAARRRFEPQELQRLHADAAREYRLRKNAGERREVERHEELARAEIVDAAAAQYAAITAWADEEGRERDVPPGGWPLRQLEDRLARRVREQRERNEQKEREEGRAAWRAAVAAAEEAAAHARAVEAWRRENERALRAAIVFLISTETRWRREEADGEATAWETLLAQERDGRAEAERIAYENFMNSPEQIALRQERERKEAAARRLAARQMRRFNKEQESFVKSCRHGRGNTSMFEGPTAKKLCVSCGVKFDENLGYYVRLRGPTIPPPAPLNGTEQQQPQPQQQQQQQQQQQKSGSVRPRQSTVTTLPPITQKKQQQGGMKNSRDMSKGSLRTKGTNGIRTT